ncbi:MAG: endonuclease III [Candidatus Altiarchaeales archaeon IMC4]|nr:MAG: endonuclease III [Candidatus Altiarchaeales archaeon IMC4]
MDEAFRAKRILELLGREYPDATTALVHKNPFELLVATILSAQCTDERVNLVTGELFKKYKTPADFSNAEIGELEKLVYSTGFYKNKAKNIKAASRMLVEDFAGDVPDNMDGLLKLPGVARKTANIVLTYGFGKNEGIAVDTHVARLSLRLGFSQSKNPEKIEEDLMRLFDRANWGLINTLLVSHGRKICNAKKPMCCGCVIMDVCLSKK